MKRRTTKRRAGARGAAIVEVLIVVALALGLGLIAMTELMGATDAQAVTEGTCIATLACTPTEGSGDASGGNPDFHGITTGTAAPEPEKHTLRDALEAAAAWTLVGATQGGISYEKALEIATHSKIKLAFELPKFGKGLVSGSKIEYTLGFEDGFQYAGRSKVTYKLLGARLGPAAAELSGEVGLKKDGTFDGVATGQLKLGPAAAGVKVTANSDGVNAKPFAEISGDVPVAGVKVLGMGLSVGIQFSQTPFYTTSTPEEQRARDAGQ